MINNWNIPIIIPIIWSPRFEILLHWYNERNCEDISFVRNEVRTSYELYSACAVTLYRSYLLENWIINSRTKNPLFEPAVGTISNQFENCPSGSCFDVVTGENCPPFLPSPAEMYTIRSFLTRNWENHIFSVTLFLPAFKDSDLFTCHFIY